MQAGGHVHLRWIFTEMSWKQRILAGAHQLTRAACNAWHWKLHCSPILYHLGLQPANPFVLLKTSNATCLLKGKKHIQQSVALLEVPGRTIACTSPTEMLKAQTSHFPPLEMTATIRTWLHKSDEAKQKHFTAHSVPGFPSNPGS